MSIFRALTVVVVVSVSMCVGIFASGCAPSKAVQLADNAEKAAQKAQEAAQKAIDESVKFGAMLDTISNTPGGIADPAVVASIRAVLPEAWREQFDIAVSKGAGLVETVTLYNTKFQDAAKAAIADFEKAKQNASTLREAANAAQTSWESTTATVQFWASTIGALLGGGALTGVLGFRSGQRNGAQQVAEIVETAGESHPSEWEPSIVAAYTAAKNSASPIVRNVLTQVQPIYSGN